MTSEQKNPAPPLRPYSRPTLTAYGSVALLTAGNGSTHNGDGGIMKPRPNMMSDRRSKQDIQRLGTHPLGLGVYRWRYREPFRARFGDGYQVGFMADEVACIVPRAVWRDNRGYSRVDYAAVADATRRQAALA